MEPLKIDLPLAELSHRKDVECKECYLLLQDNCLEYKVIGAYDSAENPEGIWKRYKVNYRWARKKENIVDVFMFYDNPEGVYSVGLEFNGISDNISWHWADPLVALSVYNQLKDYMLK